MMRITNAMMTSNTKNNININKLNEDRLNTQIATGQIISRPSEDPVVAIRALRLNTNLSQLTQYYKKNIPDAEAWLNVTETALKQTDQIFTNIKENLTTGASDTNTPTDRQKILENLKGLRAELYSSGNADYAERTVFTDYRTQKPLTFLETDAETKEANDKSEYMIHETFTAESIDTINYINSYTDTSTDPEIDVKGTDLGRIRLAYGDIKCPQTVTLNYNDNGTPASVVLNVVPSANDAAYVKPASGATLIAETGEVILSDDLKDALQAKTTTDISLEYNKNQWKSGDLRPEHYFACVQNPSATDPKDKVYYNYDQSPDSTGKLVPDPTKPNFKNQDMEIEISFNQKITINTHANEVYTHDIGRDIDELIRATQDVVDVDDRITDLEKKLATAATDAEKEKIQAQLDASKKEYSLKKDKMQKMFSKALDTFEGYADRNNLAIANIGSMQSRLKITKERVADQLQSFKELADSNINAELTESSIDFSSAKLALEAAQLAAGKIAQQTLLNYL